MILDMAMGGSTNTVLHILAIAHEAGVPFTLERIDELSKKTPNLCKVSPSSKYHIEDVARAGGIHTILGEVARGCPGLLDLTCMTVTGKTLGENIDEYDIRAQDGHGRRPAAGRGSGRRRADQPGVDRAQRGRRGPIAGRRAGRARRRGRGRRRMSRNGNGNGAGSNGHDGGDGFDAVRRDSHRRQRLLGDRRPDDAHGQPRPRRRGRQDGRRRARRCSSTPARR